MSRRGRRAVNVSNMSFLDVISCGFGAVILLLVLTLQLEPGTVSRLIDVLVGEATELEATRELLIDDSKRLRTLVSHREAELSTLRDAVANLERKLEGTRQAATAARELAAGRDKAAQALESVRQTLSEETQRLLARAQSAPAPEEAVIGGIPLDSEYIIFIIDTSGSMLRFAWPLVNKKVREVLEIYPAVKGIQVMNDMGQPMFKAYQGRWIPDTPARRREILRRLRGWQSYSNSSPVEGILAAVRQYFSQDHRISLYVFGDDFSGGSIDQVLTEVHAINRHRRGTESRVRVHAFGFPVLFLDPAGRLNRTRFSHLMRLLAEQNSGSFVGLPVLGTQELGN